MILFDLETARHLPDWLPERLRKWWHRKRCACCIYECEWDWVNCGYCLDDIKAWKSERSSQEAAR